MAKATLLADRRYDFADGSFWELRAWAVPVPVEPSRHGYKYSFVYIVNGERIVGYDNERGKGDHRHYLGRETRYLFRSIEQTLADFLDDVERVRYDAGEGAGGR